MPYVQGLDTAVAKLVQLDLHIQKEYLRDAEALAGELVADEVRKECPVYEGSDSRVVVGAIRRAVRVAASRYNPRGSVNTVVTIGEGFFQGRTFFAGFVALGHFVGSRKLGNGRVKVPANNFIQRARDNSEERAARLAGERLVELIEASAAGGG